MTLKGKQLGNILQHFQNKKYYNACHSEWSEYLRKLTKDKKSSFVETVVWVSKFFSSKDFILLEILLKLLISLKRRQGFVETKRQGQKMRWISMGLYSVTFPGVLS